MVLCVVSSHGVVWSLCLWECGVSDCLCTAVQSHTGNIRPRQLHFLWSQQDRPTTHTAWISMQIIRTFFEADSFLVLGHRLVRPLAWSWGNRILLSGIRQKRGMRKKSPANTSDLKQRIRKCMKGVPEGSASTCYGSLSIATARTYWTDWRSPAEFHIYTVMIQINSHGHGMYLPMLIKFFHSALKR
jgi:hypothetical protein